MVATITSSPEHVPLWAREVGCFRSTDNGDTWTEQNGGFTAFDVNSVVINPIGHIFAGAAGSVFRSMNDVPTNGLTSVADYFRRRKCLGSGDWGIPPEDLSLPERLLAGYFAASDPLSRCESRSEADRASPNASTAALRVC